MFTRTVSVSEDEEVGRSSLVLVQAEERPGTPAYYNGRERRRLFLSAPSLRVYFPSGV